MTFPAVPFPASRRSPAPFAALIGQAAALAGVAPQRALQQFGQLSAAWPAPLPTPSTPPRLSTLTPGGVPLELAVTLGHAPSLRYILDPADFRQPGPQRALGSAHLTRAFLHGEARHVHEALTAAALRPDWLAARGARFGVWLAPQHWPDGREALRVYYNLAPLRWATGGRLRAALEHLTPVLPFAPPPLTATVPAGLCLAMLGMEVQGGAVTNLKWYFRACRPLERRDLTRLLDRAGLSAQQGALDAFCAALLGDAPGIAQRQGVLYVSGNRAGERGVNLYLNAPLLGADDAAVARRVHEVAGALGLNAAPYAALRAQLPGSGAGGRQHTLTGLGLNARGVRLNQYLCPT